MEVRRAAGILARCAPACSYRWPCSRSSRSRRRRGRRRSACPTRTRPRSPTRGCARCISATRGSSSRGTRRPPSRPGCGRGSARSRRPGSSRTSRSSTRAPRAARTRRARPRAARRTRPPSGGSSRASRRSARTRRGTRPTMSLSRSPPAPRRSPALRGAARRVPVVHGRRGRRARLRLIHPVDPALPRGDERRPAAVGAAQLQRRHARALRIARTRPRIGRVYVYQWRAGATDRFDSGLVRPDGTARASLSVLAAALTAVPRVTVAWSARRTLRATVRPALPAGAPAATVSRGLARPLA